ncbi:hypothetical protein [Dysosmobacter sp.]|uniref:hypothetical protein n=1 Tax=Dysosmobacter sp. TaxID=2591382 RepID=UPI002A84D799|nr:hypothetical protein [Dysosmobacter sp.]MDY3985702.1 hypothetical protein [Dysosmobacter sp.]
MRLGLLFPSFFNGESAGSDDVGAGAQAVEKVRRPFSTPSQYLDFLAALLPENLPLRGANACWRRLFAGI